MGISLHEAFVLLEQATSVSDLRALVNSVDAKVSSFENPNGVTLQLYAGDADVGKPMYKVIDGVAGNLMPDGSSLIIIDQTDLGKLLLDKNKFLNKLEEVIENDLNSSHPDFNDLQEQEKKDLIKLNIAWNSKSWLGLVKDVASRSPKISVIVDVIADIKPENFLDMLLNVVRYPDCGFAS